MQVSLNPNYHFKWDTKRVILFSKSTPLNRGYKDWCSFLHPLHVVILGVLSYEHDIDNAIVSIQKYVNVKREAIEHFISLLTENAECAHLPLSIGTITFPPYLLLLGNISHSQTDISSIIERSLSIKEVDLNEPRLYHTPLKVTWMFNNQCLVHCKYCYADTIHKHKEFSFDRFKELMQECSRNHIAECEVIGGDFFIKRNWDKYLQCMQENNFIPPYLSTKKTLNQEEIKTLIQLKYTGVLQFSLDSLIQEDLKEIIHCSNRYIIHVKNMFQYLSEQSYLPFRVRVNTVLIQKNTNKKTLDELYIFLSQLNIIDEWEIRFAMPSFSKNDSFLCTQEQITWATCYITELERNSPFKLSFIADGITQNKPMCDLSKEKKYIYRCTANLRHCFVLPDGKVTICERLYWNPSFIIGDLNTMSLHEVWNSEKAHKLYYGIIDEISPFSLCNQCVGKNECFQKKKRCWVDIANKWGSNITYPDPICINSLKQKS